MTGRGTDREKSILIHTCCTPIHVPARYIVPLQPDVQITHHGQSWTEQIWVFTHHTSWWTLTKISKIWRKKKFFFSMALTAEFPFQKQPKFFVLNYFSTFSCHVTHHNLWWTLRQWTLSVTHHRLWTSGRKVTVCDDHAQLNILFKTILNLINLICPLLRHLLQVRGQWLYNFNQFISFIQGGTKIWKITRGRIFFLRSGWPPIQLPKTAISGQKW